MKLLKLEFWTLLTAYAVLLELFTAFLLLALKL